MAAIVSLNGQTTSTRGGANRDRWGLEKDLATKVCVRIRAEPSRMPPATGFIISTIVEVVNGQTVRG